MASKFFPLLVRFTAAQRKYLRVYALKLSKDTGRLITSSDAVRQWVDSIK